MACSLPNWGGGAAALAETLDVLFPSFSSGVSVALPLARHGEQGHPSGERAQQPAFPTDMEVRRNGQDASLSSTSIEEVAGYQVGAYSKRHLNHSGSWG